MDSEYLEPNMISAQEIDDVVSQFRLRSSDTRLSQQQMQKFFNELPKLTETDITTSGHQDDVCPICFNTLLAVLAEEEVALAMDSPAQPIEELGVTNLHNTCGHIFCRKDIMKWIIEGHNSCPSCRRPLLAERPTPSSTQPASLSGEGWLRNWIVDSSMVSRDNGLSIQLPIISLDSFHALGLPEGQPHRRNGRGEFAGMYS